MGLVITGCQSITELSRDYKQEVQHTEAQTVDYINFGDKQYINAWELVVTDPSALVKIGEVERGSRLPLGTEVYEIIDYPEKDIVAVKDDSQGLGIVGNISGYSIYVWYEGPDKPSHYPDITEAQTKQIKIYRGVDLLRTIDEDEVSSFLSLMSQQGPINEFQTEQALHYTVLLNSDHTIGLNYGISEKNGEFGLDHIESKLPAEIARYFIE